MLRKTNKSKSNKYIKTIRKYANKKGGEKSLRKPTKSVKSVRKSVKSLRKPHIVAWGDLSKIAISPIKDTDIAEKPNLSKKPILLVIPTHGNILSKHDDEKSAKIIDLKNEFPKIKSLIKIGFSQPGNSTLFNPQSEKYSQLQFILELQSQYGSKIDINKLLEWIVTDEKQKHEKFIADIAKNIDSEKVRTEFLNIINKRGKQFEKTQEGVTLTTTWDKLGSKYTIFKYIRDAIGPQQGLYDKEYSYSTTDMDIDGQIMSDFTDKILKEYDCESDYDIDEETEDVTVSISLYKILSCISKKNIDNNNMDIIIIDTTCNNTECELQAAPAVLG